MKEIKSIVFLFDSGKKIGSGHYGRCLSFAEYILRFRPGYNFFFLSKDKTFSKDIRNKNYFFKLLKNNNQNLLKSLSDINPKYIFIDSYLINYDMRKKIYKLYKNSIIIEDEIKRKQIGKVYVNYNYKSLIKKHVKNLKFEKKFIGYEYFFKNINFLNYKPPKIKEIKEILIYLGSTKNTKLLKYILEILSSNFFQKIKFKIILGKYEKYNFKLNYQKKNFSYFKNLTNQKFLKLASNCQVAIGSGGVSCWERIYLGLVNFVIITAKNQTFFTKQMNNSKYIFNLGVKNNISKELLKKKLNKVLLDKQIIKNIYNKSSKVLLKNKVLSIIKYLNL